jgi:hypothetical protein
MFCNAIKSIAFMIFAAVSHKRLFIASTTLKNTIRISNFQKTPKLFGRKPKHPFARLKLY